MWTSGPPKDAVKRQFHVGLKPDGERRAALEKVNKGGCHVGISEIAVF